MTLLWDFDCGSFDNFQSYQSIQINHDVIPQRMWNSADVVSIVSIQTDQSRPFRGRISDKLRDLFQSYQSRQINPDTAIGQFLYAVQKGFNRINPNRSIPTPK